MQLGINTTGYEGSPSIMSCTTRLLCKCSLLKGACLSSGVATVLWLTQPQLATHVADLPLPGKGCVGLLAVEASR